jgi:hypothetical protein
MNMGTLSPNPWDYRFLARMATLVWGGLYRPAIPAAGRRSGRIPA